MQTENAGLEKARATRVGRATSDYLAQRALVVPFSAFGEHARSAEREMAPRVGGALANSAGGRGPLEHVRFARGADHDRRGRLNGAVTESFFRATSSASPAVQFASSDQVGASQEEPQAGNPRVGGALANSTAAVTASRAVRSHASSDRPLAPTAVGDSEALRSNVDSSLTRYGGHRSRRRGSAGASLRSAAPHRSRESTSRIRSGRMLDLARAARIGLTRRAEAPPPTGSAADVGHALASDNRRVMQRPRILARACVRGSVAAFDRQRARRARGRTPVRVG